MLHKYHEYIQTLMVNVSGVSIAWLVSLSTLQKLVFLSLFVYNCIKIYQALFKKNDQSKEH